MERNDLESWIALHPGSVHADSKTLLDRCENDAKDHAHEDAWIHAKEVAQRSLRRFEAGFGYPASDSFVTREVCHDVARQLKTHEPTPDAEGQSEWVSRSVLDLLDAEAQRVFTTWLHEMAEKEEHAAWLEIVRFTDRRARSLIEERHMTDQCEWDLDHRFSLVAARVVKMLISDFEAYAADERKSSMDSAGTH